MRILTINCQIERPTRRMITKTVKRVSIVGPEITTREAEDVKQNQIFDSRIPEFVLTHIIF